MSDVFLEECWAEEPGIRLRILDGGGGRLILSIIEVDPRTGGPESVVEVARATLVSFRIPRVVDALRGRAELSR